MRRIHYRLISIATLVFVCTLAHAQETLSILGQDNKTLVITVYGLSKQDCRGVVVISPGAGGSEKGLAYLGQAMSALGYFAVVAGHQESGRQALRQHTQGKGLREGLEQLISDPEAYQARLIDIATAKSWAAQRCHANTAILLGHSMGAATTMMMAGAKNQLGISASDLFDAYVALSPQGAGSIFPGHAWREIRKPVLTITGTRDDELGGRSWETRLEPFNDMQPGCKWSAVIEGANHRNLAGNGMSRTTEALTLKTIQAFLQAFPSQDCKPPPAQTGIQMRAK
jgi:dienelactone hydrolase